MTVGWRGRAGHRLPHDARHAAHRSLVADLVTGTGGMDCSSFICKALRAVAQAEIGNLGETATNELTSTYTSSWNRSRRSAAAT